MNSLNHIIHSQKKIQSFMENFTKKNASFPREISGMQSGFYAFFLREYLYRDDANILLVVPGEKEAKDILEDLRTVCGTGGTEESATAQIHYLPWWSSIPYRPVSRGSRVFGSSVSRLSKRSGAANKKNTRNFYNNPALVFNSRCAAGIHGFFAFSALCRSKL